MATTEGNTSKILITDDEPGVCEILSRWLMAEGYSCATAFSGEQAIRLLGDDDFRLIVSDVLMPGLSGLDLLELVRNRFPETAVILVTGVDDKDTAFSAVQLGAYGYVIKPFKKNEILINVSNALERQRLTLVSQQYERILEARVMERTAEVREREEEIIFRLLSTAAYRDDETGDHIRRIGLHSSVIARHLGWEDQAVEDMRLAGAMHDIGKVGIPDNILKKPGNLTPEEFEIMKTHAEIGAKILGGSDAPMIRMAAEIARSHHEKWDGSGYPRALPEDAIPEAGRIVAVADVYDALVNDRVYRPAMSEAAAIAIMNDGKGKHFDSRILEAFFDLLPEIRRIRAQVEDERSLVSAASCLHAALH
jgi:putative two-component system response regulator